ncbi:FadR/GntR family transcriptional regulator [Stomatohabitans albus]|uniref:FadR/GntR family transcriptional regulator n=1 Tax=Stomatohabitans albus TaxID=3110766 RepID=UPI00300C9BAB
MLKNIGQSAREIVVEYIEQGILSGELRPGQKVMSERELAAHLGVCRGAVREGVARLEGMGLVQFSRGVKGGTTIRRDGGLQLAHLFRLHLSLHGADKSDVMEVRIALERATAAFAANAVTTELIEDLTELVDAMGKQTDRAAFDDLDTRFHHRIANHGDNGLLFDLTRAIRTTVADPIRKATDRIEDWNAYQVLLTEEHRGIMQAIASGDPTQAADVMERHIRHAWEILPHDLGQHCGQSSDTTEEPDEDHHEDLGNQAA